ncbi:MAG: tRNA-dihydrouridine synthase family protein [Candidatus Methanomethylophilaceae archaeon]|nr:tRNA-dihydrouridine synthase family protein [Candidatus Methanomethylophilaceae archaeon]
MWKIGDIDIDGKAVLGPMSGFTFESYRNFMRPFGIALSFTEMTSSQGIIHDCERTSSMYIGFRPDRPTGLQLFGNSPETISESAAIALKKNPGIDFFDVNLGCPVPKVRRSGSGSALAEYPEKCGQTVRCIKKRTGLPVTVKIRLGKSMDSLNYREVIRETVSAGADAVTVHARTVKEGYSGIPHYDLIRNLGSEISVPLIVSGNIFSLDDAVNAIRITGADGVMIARGGIGNPFLATQIDSWFRYGKRLPDPAAGEQIKNCKILSEMIISEKGEEAGVRKLHSIAPKFLSGYGGCRRYRHELANVPRTKEELFAILEKVNAQIDSGNVHARKTYVNAA